MQEAHSPRRSRGREWRCSKGAPAMRQRISGLVAPGAILAAAIASLVFLSTAAAESPKGRFHSAHTSDDRNSLAEKATFTADTPKVYVTYTLSDVNPGTKVKI